MGIARRSSPGQQRRSEPPDHTSCFYQVSIFHIYFTQREMRAVSRMLYSRYIVPELIPLRNRDSASDKWDPIGDKRWAGGTIMCGSVQVFATGEVQSPAQRYAEEEEYGAK